MESEAQWLIGETIADLPADRLPTIIDALRYFYHDGNYNARNERSSAMKTSTRVFEVWRIHGKDPQDKSRIANKLEKFVAEYKNLKRYKKRDSDIKRNIFRNRISKQFDVAKDITRQNVGVNPVPNDPEFNLDATVPNEYPIVRGYQLRQNQAPGNNSIEIDIDDDTVKNTPDKELCSLYERAGISSRMASFLFLAHAKSLGIAPESLVCSTSTVVRNRHQFQKETADKLIDELDRNLKYTLNWDGKTFVKRGYKDKRMAVNLSRGKFSRTLDIVNVKTGKSKENTEAIWKVIEELHLEDCVDSLGFDTENVNSGRKGGICLRLQEKFGREMLECACRHHIDELLLKAGYNSIVELGSRSTAPNIPMFETFCEQFRAPGFNRNLYTGMEGDTFFAACLPIAEREDLTDFCKRRLSSILKSTRSDYVELCKLVILLLSPEDRQIYNVYAPGSHSRARFMSRILYCVKIYIYRGQLKMPRREMDRIRRFILFVLKIYLKHWLTVNDAISAPRNDLRLLKQLHNLTECMPVTAQTVFNTMKNHLWYVSEVMVAMSFFDPCVSADEKNRMVANLNRTLLSQPNKKRFQLADDVNVENLGLHDFVSTRTRTFFDITQIDCSFLNFDPSEWINNEGYINGQKTISKLSVVNDVSERTIALFQNIESLAATDVRKRRILQVVEEHRQQYSSMNKHDLIEELWKH